MQRYPRQSWSKPRLRGQAPWRACHHRGSPWQERRKIRACYTDTHQLAEGAGAIALAGLLQECSAQPGARVGAVLSGGNIDRADFAAILSRDAP